MSRPNRFVSHVTIDGEEHIAHVKNTGRCKEIFTPGATVFLEDHIDNMKNRKTRYSLVAAQKPSVDLETGFRLINIDSQAPNKVVAEGLECGLITLPEFGDGNFLIKAEQTYKRSRFDFYIEGRSGKKAYLEVKGVTLEEEGIARFPDAPTERGIKHIYELIEAIKKGFKAYIIFVIQMKGVKYFEPNDVTHEAFGEALRQAAEEGVCILAYDCNVTENTMSVRKNIKVEL